MAGIGGGNVSPIQSWCGVCGGRQQPHRRVSTAIFPSLAHGRRAGVVMKRACDSNSGNYKFDVKQTISGFAAAAERVYRGR
jgi:hypothetical protein